MIHKTKRLQLREASLSDAPFILELLNSPGWIKHIGDRYIKSIADAEKYIQSKLIESYRKNGYGLYVMEISEVLQPIGLCGLLKRESLDHLDIGFAILPQFSKQGFTFEAAHAILKSKEETEIYGITYEGNLASRRLLEKLGLKHIRNFQFGDYEEESMLFSTNHNSATAVKKSL